MTSKRRVREGEPGGRNHAVSLSREALTDAGIRDIKALLLKPGELLTAGCVCAEAVVAGGVLPALLTLEPLVVVDA